MTIASRLRSATTRRRASTTRRTAALLGGALVIGAPLVAQALADDAVTDPPVLDAADDGPAPRAAAVEVSYVSTRTPAPGGRGGAVAERQAERLRADAEAQRAAEVQALLTAPYAWDEQSPRVIALQQLLQVTVDGRYGWATRAAHLQVLQFAGLPTVGVPTPPLPAGTTAEQWEALRQCESNGDYTIVSSSGAYRGAYQFNRSTWDSVAGRHDPSLVGIDPAQAAPADQDAMAYALYSERGAGPWPHCGRHLS